jgi:hypothetical protein
MTTEFVQIPHADGTIEYQASNIEQLEQLGREAAENSTTPVMTLEQAAESVRLHEKFMAREYLKNTDWYAARLAETGQAIPADVLEQRQAARQLLSS